MIKSNNLKKDIKKLCISRAWNGDDETRTRDLWRDRPAF